MVSMLEVIREGYLGDMNETSRNYLNRIDRRVQGMLLMIHELMMLAKSQGKQPQMEVKAVNLKSIASRIQQNFQEEAIKKRLTFEVIIPEDLPEIKGDPEMIEQLFENLISNAIKYTPEGGRVGMTFWTGGNGMVRMVVSDNGIGIPKSEMSRLFTQFFRASNVQDVIGTGLGLTIVKEIVDKHGGQIEVESEEGLGTTFIVHLPVAGKNGAKKMEVMDKKMKGLNLIDESIIQAQLEASSRCGGQQVREVIAKARELKGLDSAECATLLQCNDPAVLEGMFPAAREANEFICGNG